MRILFAVDLRETDLDLRLTAAVHWAVKLGAVLDLLYVTPDLHSQASYLGSDLGILRRELDAIRDAQQGRLEAMLQNIPAEHRGSAQVVTSSSPGETIADEADGYELLMLHTHGRKGLAQLFLGSVAERVVRVAKVSTMVLRVPR